MVVSRKKAKGVTVANGREAGRRWARKEEHAGGGWREEDTTALLVST